MAHRSATVKPNVDVTPYVARVADVQLDILLTGCPVCAHYVKRRGDTLRLAVVVAAERYRVFAPLLMVRYVAAVHARHLAGDSLSTRPHTPVKRFATGSSRIRVQRACNGCAASLGDANDSELDAAENGRPLPDVRLECGCWTETAA